MNLVDQQIPPQVFLDSAVPPPIDKGKQHAQAVWPESLIRLGYGHDLSPRINPISVGLSETAVQLSEPITFDHPTTRISVRIADAVQLSRRILDLPENWDDEGSPAYALQTWERAAQFVINTSITFRRFSGVWVNPPKITPGPDASIDVRWKTSMRSVLINFPGTHGEAVQFFGSDRDVETIKGTLDLSSPNQWILVWLMR